MSWERIRLAFLGLLCTGMGSTVLLLVLVRGLGPVEEAITNEPEFPVVLEQPIPDVDLEGWTLNEDVTIDISDNSASFGAILEGKIFIYEQEQDQTELVIQMLHLVGLDPDVRDVLWGIREVPDYRLIQSREAAGHYGLLEFQGRAFLSSCINPSGSNTFNSPQFRRNRYLFDMTNPRRIFRWLLMNEPLQDHRCLVVHLSLPLGELDADEAFEILQAVWVDWQEDWRDHFQSLAYGPATIPPPVSGEPPLRKNQLVANELIHEMVTTILRVS